MFLFLSIHPKIVSQKSRLPPLKNRAPGKNQDSKGFLQAKNNVMIVGEGGIPGENVKLFSENYATQKIRTKSCFCSPVFDRHSN